MNKFMEANKKVEKTVVSGYKAVENAAVSAYKAVENGVVGRYKKVEDAFVESFLTPDESSEQGKSDINEQTSTED